MDRDVQKLCFNGLLLWGALYVGFVFVAATHGDNRVAQIGAVVTAGVTYLDYMLMLALPDARRVHVTAFGACLVAGVLSGLSLLA